MCVFVSVCMCVYMFIDVCVCVRRCGGRKLILGIYLPQSLPYLFEVASRTKLEFLIQLDSLTESLPDFSVFHPSVLGFQAWPANPSFFTCVPGVYTWVLITGVERVLWTEPFRSLDPMPTLFRWMNTCMHEWMNANLRSEFLSQEEGSHTPVRSNWGPALVVKLNYRLWSSLDLWEVNSSKARTGCSPSIQGRAPT